MKNDRVPTKWINIVILAMTLTMGIVTRPPLGKAEMIQGEITAVKADENSFSLKRPNASNRALSEELPMVLHPGAKLTGLSSLSELAVGDEVTVNAKKKQGTEHWEATAIEISKVKIHEPI